MDIQWDLEVKKMQLQIGEYDPEYDQWIYYYNPERYMELLNEVNRELDSLISLGHKKTKIKKIFRSYIKSAREERDKRLAELKLEIRENGWVKKNDPLQLEKKDVIDEFILYKMAIKDILKKV